MIEDDNYRPGLTIIPEAALMRGYLFMWVRDVAAPWVLNNVCVSVFENSTLYLAIRWGSMLPRMSWRCQMHVCHSMSSLSRLSHIVVAQSQGDSQSTTPFVEQGCITAPRPSTTPACQCLSWGVVRCFVIPILPAEPPESRQLHGNPMHCGIPTRNSAMGREGLTLPLYQI